MCAQHYDDAETPLYSPDMSQPRVGVGRLILGRHAWANAGDPDATELFFYSPDLMVAWAEAVRAEPRDGVIVEPVGEGWRLTVSPTGDVSAEDSMQ